MKDDLQIILNSPEESYDAATAVEHLKIDLAQIFECYKENMPELEPKDAEIARKAKNSALSAENALKVKLRRLILIWNLLNNV